jgi:hypothetical protein
MSHLEKTVRSLNPTALLEIGCGCGRHLTSSLTGFCDRVVATDIAPYGSRWQEIARTSPVRFLRMDATALGFPDSTFPLVIEKDTLHHISRWPAALSEMVRVSSDHILLEEPVDELRSAAKQRTQEAQELFLQLQAEVGTSHYRHLDPGEFLSTIQERACLIDVHMNRRDTSLTFDEFFHDFLDLAAKSQREDYWRGQLQDLRSRFDGAPLCKADRLTVLISKNQQLIRRRRR